MTTSRTCKAAAVVILLGAVFASVVSAEPQNRRSKRNKAKPKYVAITGSLIPQKVKVKSIGTDSGQNIRIYTRRELESTGRQTVAGALALDPSIQITGTH